VTKNTAVQRTAKIMMALHNEIATEIEKPQMDPGRLMRLIAAGVNQLLFTQAMQLTKWNLPSSGEDPRQLRLFDMSENR